MRLMWLEAAVCLAWPLFASLMGTLMSFHYLVVMLRGESKVPIEQCTTVLYSAGSWFGIGAVLVLLTTQLGARASKPSLSFAKVGLAFGAAVALAIPEGAWPQLRFINNFDIPREIFLSALCGQRRVAPRPLTREGAKLTEPGRQRKTT